VKPHMHMGEEHGERTTAHGYPPKDNPRIETRDGESGGGGGGGGGRSHTSASDTRPEHDGGGRGARHGMGALRLSPWCRVELSVD
jgi:hypothetical protein